MKNRRLLFLVAVMLILSFVLSACNANNKDNGDDEPAPQETSEFDKHFVFNPDVELLTEVVEIKGENVIIANNGLAYITVSQDLDNYNNVVTTYSVVSVDGNVQRYQTSCSVPYREGVTAHVPTTISFLANGAIFCVRTVSRYDSTDPNSQISSVYYGYYATSTGASIATVYPTVTGEYWDEPTIETRRVGNILRVNLNDQSVAWLDNDTGKLLYTYNAEAADAIPDIDVFGEYNNSTYVDCYDYESEEYIVQVFDGSGVCKVEAKIPLGEDSWAQSSILNNGNVLVYVATSLDPYAPEFTAQNGDAKVDYKYYVINYRTGEMLPVELDYLPIYVTAAYHLSDESELLLAEGMQNVAYIYTLNEDKTIATVAIAVVDNDLNVLYKLELPEGFSLANGYTFMNKEHLVISDMMDAKYVYDVLGNKVAKYPENTTTGHTQSFIYTSEKVYDHSMKLVYDAVANDMKVVESHGDSVVLSKANKYLGVTEYYVLASGSTTPVLIADGYDKVIYDVRNNYCLVYDKTTASYILYNEKAESLVISENRINVRSNDGILIVDTVREGERYFYVVK